MDITNALTRIQAIWKDVEGVRAAPNEPPETPEPFPIAITYERSGELDPANSFSDTWGEQTGVIWSELHIQRGNLPLGVRAALTYRDPFLRALLADPDLNDKVMIIDSVKWTFQPMKWGGIDTIGYRFEISVQLELAPDA